MGINITDANVVEFDDTHQKRVNTSLDKNPSQNQLPDLIVRHVFRRNRTGDKGQDGNPLIYALKGLHGYSIEPAHRQLIMDRAVEILATFAEDLEADFIMPLPSSNDFCGEFAQLVCTATEKSYLSPSFIAKKSISQVLDEYGDEVPDNLNQYASRKYKSQLKTWRQMKGGQLVSMKDIHNSIRPYFDPLTLRGDAPDIAGQKIVIADDLMSTGTSLRSARNLLESIGCKTTSATCFLSRL